MKKSLILSVLMLGLTITLNCALAQEVAPQEATNAPITEEQITTQDLGIENPGILPTSPIYFLKNWGRNMKRLVTFNPVKKAAFELNIVNQQAAEIVKMREVAPDRVDAVEKAAANYQTNMDRLNSRLEALKDTSQNPNIDKLMENLADRSIKHQQLFDELKQKFEDKPKLKQQFDLMRNKMNEVLAKIPIKFDSPEAFKERVKKAIGARPDTLFREIRGIEIIERLQEKLPEERQAELESIKDDLMKKFEERINAMPQEAQKTFILPHVLEKMPGGPALKIKILGEMRERMRLTPEMKEKIETAQGQILEEAIKRGEITKEKAEEQIKRAEKSIEKLDHAIEEEDVQRAVVRITKMKNALAQAKKHFNEARLAFTAGKYGEAFGQATSADAIAKNGLISSIAPQPASTPGLKPIPAPDRVFPETNKGCSPRPVCLDATPRCLLPEPASGWCPKAIPPAEQIFCTLEYLPVCGVDGKTYSNKCHAQRAGVAIKALKACPPVESTLPVPK